MKKNVQLTKKQIYIISIAGLVLVAALIGVLLYACSDDGGNIVGTWKTRDHVVNEAGELVALPDQEVVEFEFRPDGTGRQYLPKFGEQEIMKFSWKTSGHTLTITEEDGREHKFWYGIEDGHILTISPEGSEASFQYIKQ